MKKLIGILLFVFVFLFISNVISPIHADETWIWAFPTGSNGTITYSNYSLENNQVLIIEANKATIQGNHYQNGILIAQKNLINANFSLTNGIIFVTSNEKARDLFQSRYDNLVRNNYARANIIPLPEWNWNPSSESSEEWLYSSIPPWGFSTGWCEASLNGHWVDLKQSCNNALVVWNRSNERINIRYKRSNPADSRDRSLVTIYGSGNSLESIKSVYASQMGVPINHLSVRYLPN